MLCKLRFKHTPSHREWTEVQACTWLKGVVRPFTAASGVMAWYLIETFFTLDIVRILVLWLGLLLALVFKSQAGDPSGEATIEQRLVLGSLSLIIIYIKQMRDKWKLLERAATMWGISGAIVLLLEEMQGINTPRHLTWLTFVERLHAATLADLPLPPLAAGGQHAGPVAELVQQHEVQIAQILDQLAEASAWEEQKVLYQI